MKADQFHILLILLSCLAAYWFPFELFLFSYIVLGALHYLTELAWLHEKKYFTSSKTELIVIFLCAIIISVNYISYRLGFNRISFFPFSNSTYSIYFIFLAFLMAFSAIILKNWKEKLFLFILFGLGIYLFRNNLYYLLIFGLLLPTLIHVFVFTGIFMLVGIKKNPTFWSKICFGSFILCAISFFIIPASPSFLAENIKSTYLESGFDTLNKVLIQFFNENIFIKEAKENETLIFESVLSLKLQRFIAFAYTYHYLNWFSKVHIIAWHKVNKIRLIWAILLWLVALGVYLYDFKTGILTLYFLSMVHVLMEFPLNIQSLQILIRK